MLLMPEKSADDKPGERIAKVIARAGLASRRAAEALIAAGRVSVNGQAIASPALNVTPRDQIAVDGVPLPSAERTRLFRYRKPRGLISTHADPQGRPTLFAKLPKRLPRLIGVGRLDFNSEGLLLLTNDGGLARALELPATGWLRRYRVRALGRVTQEALDRLRGGTTIAGVRYGPIEATLDREQGANVWLTMGLREGKNREVRKVLEALGLKVNRLIRVSYGPFELGELEDGAVAEVETEDLRAALGPELAKQAHADFESSIATARSHSPLIPAKAGIQNGRIARYGRRGSPLSRGRADETQAPATRVEPAAKGKDKKHHRRRDRRGGPRPARPRPK
jgi:23S rRNA pseudouridine2605 synthase